MSGQVEAPLGNRRKVCRQRPLGWSNEREDATGILQLSVEAETEFVASQLEAELEEGKQRIHERFLLRDEARRLLPHERVCKCGKRKIDRNQPVKLMRSVNTGLGFFSNIQLCGSVWGDPVCAAKITEKKRTDLKKGLDSTKEKGLLVYHVTLTIPHHRGQDTRRNCDDLLKALKRKQNRTAWRSWCKRMGVVGTIRALEVTYGWRDDQGCLVYNGAHVHIHMLIFVKPHTWLARYRKPDAADLLPGWQSACKAVGLPEPNEHGVVIQSGEYAASYVAKWGLEHEMTKLHVKSGRGGGRTPWDLLRESLKGNTEAGRLFQEHYRAFKGRRQLVWSKGLRKLLGLDAEQTDEELANEQTETAVEVYELTEHQWYLVRRYGGQVEADLCVAVKSGPKHVKEYLACLERFHGS